MASFLLLLGLMTLAAAAPQIALPLNAQVPPLAYVSSPFQFTFSASTFASSSTKVDYKLSTGPSWLRLDGPSRTFSGTPGPSDVGSFTVNLTATDQTGSTAVAATLIVAEKQGPKLGWSVASQLKTVGPNAAPGSLWLYASSRFNITFSPDTFSGTGSNRYAVSADNTPLPSWVDFDGAALRFSGTTPHLSSLLAPPETFGIKLIASDVAGFAGASWTFSLVVGAHELAFDQPEQSLNITKGSPVNITTLGQHLRLDGKPIRSGDIKDVQAITPPWLNFDKSTLVLSGTAPQDATSQNVTIAVADVFGDDASTTLLLRVETETKLFTGTIFDFNATVGQDFGYDISSLGYVAGDVDAESSTEPDVPWIKFDSSRLKWSGTVPNDTREADITIRLKATSKSSGTAESQSFKLRLVPSNTRPVESGSISKTSAPSTSRPTSTAQQLKAQAKRKKAIVAGVVVPSLVLIAALIILCCCLRRRERKKARPSSPAGRDISRPVKSPETEMPAVEDPGIYEKDPKRHSDKPPRLPRLHTWSVIWTPDPNLRSVNASPQHPQSEPSQPIGIATTEADRARSPLEGFNPSRTATNFSLRTTTTITPPPPIPAKSPARPLSLAGLGLSIPSSRSEMGSSGLPLTRRVSGVGHGYPSRLPHETSGPSGYGIAQRSWRDSQRRTWTTIRSSDMGSSSEQTRSSGMLDQFPLPTGATVRLVKSPSRALDPTRISASRRERYGHRRGGTSPLFGGSLRPSSRSTTRTRPNTRSSFLPPRLPYDTSSGMVTVDSFLRSLSGGDSLDTDSPGSRQSPSFSHALSSSPNIRSRFRTFGSMAAAGYADAHHHDLSVAAWDRETTASAQFMSASEADNSTSAGTEDRFVESVDGDGNRRWRPAEPSPRLLHTPDMERMMMRSPETDSEWEDEAEGERDRADSRSEISVAVPVTMSRTSRPLDLRLGGAGDIPLLAPRHSRVADSRGSSMSANPGSPRLVELRSQRPISVEVGEGGYKRWGSQRGSTAFM